MTLRHWGGPCPALSSRKRLPDLNLYLPPGLSHFHQEMVNNQPVGTQPWFSARGSHSRLWKCGKLYGVQVEELVLAGRCAASIGATSPLGDGCPCEHRTVLRLDASASPGKKSHMSIPSICRSLGPSPLAASSRVANIVDQMHLAGGHVAQPTDDAPRPVRTLQQLSGRIILSRPVDDTHHFAARRREDTEPTASKSPERPIPTDAVKGAVAGRRRWGGRTGRTA
jgi:hypothetical protein